MGIQSGIPFDLLAVHHGPGDHVRRGARPDPVASGGSRSASRRRRPRSRRRPADGGRYDRRDRHVPADPGEGPRRPASACGIRASAAPHRRVRRSWPSTSPARASTSRRSSRSGSTSRAARAPRCRRPSASCGSSPASHGVVGHPAAHRAARPSGGGRGSCVAGRAVGRGAPRQPARRQAGEPDQHDRAAASSSPRRSRWPRWPGILSERSGMFNIALEGKMLVGACIAAVVGERRHLARATTCSPRCRRPAAMLVAGAARPPPGLAGHPPQDRPDHRRHGDQHRRGRDHELHLPADPGAEHRAQQAADRSSRCRMPLLADIPVLGPIFFAAKPYVYVAYVMVAS